MQSFDLKSSGVPRACDLSYPGQVWDDCAQPPEYTAQGSEAGIYRPEVLKSIEDEITRMDSELRSLSLKIHGIYESLFPLPV